MNNEYLKKYIKKKNGQKLHHYFRPHRRFSLIYNNTPTKKMNFFAKNKHLFMAQLKTCDSS